MCFPGRNAPSEISYTTATAAAAAAAAAAVLTKTRPCRTGKHHGPEGRTESKICVSRGRNVPSEISYKKLAIRYSRMAAGSLLAAALQPLLLLLPMLLKPYKCCCCCCYSCFICIDTENIAKNWLLLLLLLLLWRFATREIF